MDLAIFGSRAPALGAADYLRAKLECEETPYGLRSTLENDPGRVYVVDVRDHAAFDAEHIAGAVNIPAEELATRLTRLPKDRTVVAYCWDMTCALAPKAALELVQKGFHAQFLAGGIEEWKRKGFPVRKTV